MARDVTHYPTDGRAFQTAFGSSDPWERRKRRRDQESDHEVAHVKLLRPSVLIKPLRRRKVAGALAATRLFDDHGNKAQSAFVHCWASFV
jgi:hypothetical protein